LSCMIFSYCCVGLFVPIYSALPYKEVGLTTGCEEAFCAYHEWVWSSLIVASAVQVLKLKRYRKNWHGSRRIKLTYIVYKDSVRTSWRTQCGSIRKTS